MPLLGLGTWQLESKNCAEFVYLAIKNGLHHIDTADLYENHQETGEGINRAIEEGIVKRDDLYVVTKLGFSDYENVAPTVERMLKELNLKYVDLILMHWPYYVKREGEKGIPTDDRANMKVEFKFNRIDTYRELEASCKQGQTKALGVSNFNSEHLMEILTQCEVPPLVNQIEFHIFNQGWDLYNFSMHYNVATVGYCVMGTKEKIPKSPINDTTVKEIAARYGKTTGQICLKYLVQQQIPALFRSNNQQRLLDNLKLFDFEINEEDMQKLRKRQSENVRLVDPFPDYKFGSK